MMSEYSRLVSLNDALVQVGMAGQVLGRDSRYYGGVIDPENGIAWPNHNGGTPDTMAIWTAALVNPDSSYYHDKDLLERLSLASDYMLRFQHDDGTISPGWTNYHSPPDTAFVIVGYSQLYQLLAADGWAPLAPVAAKMRLFLERTIPAMLTGGCHTPNHRWVLCAALGYLHKLFGIEDAARRAEQWLAEGMDCTPDGEWTERSNGIYNAVSDIMLIHAARLLNRPELLEPVRANLRMMVYLVHPSGEVVTDYSGRQDFGHVHSLAGYFPAYTIMAHLDRDPLFAAMAAWAGEFLKHPGGLPNNALLAYLLDPSLRNPGVSPAELPTHYRRMINGSFLRDDYLKDIEAAGHGGRIKHSRLHTDFGSQVARHRSGNTSVTIMTETSSFFALRHGSTRLLAVQIASYFEPGFVPMTHMEPLDNGYRLSAVQEKGYYGPVPAHMLPEAAQQSVSPWYLLPHHQRLLTHSQKHTVEADITESVDGWKLRVRSDEPAEVMTQISLVFGGEGEFIADGLKPAGENASFWTGGAVRYITDRDWLEVTGGDHEHMASSVRGASYPAGCRTLLVNVMTPFEKEIFIRLSPGDTDSQQ